MFKKVMKCTNQKKNELEFGNMLIPKLFRWIFFRKKLVSNTFDALRNADTIYVDASIDLGHNQKSFENSVHLNNWNMHEFIQNTDKQNPIVLFGNSKSNLNKIHTDLEMNGFEKVFCVGSIEELIKIKDELK